MSTVRLPNYVLIRLARECLAYLEAFGTSRVEHGEGDERLLRAVTGVLGAANDVRHELHRAIAPRSRAQS